MGLCCARHCRSYIPIFDPILQTTGIQFLLLLACRIVRPLSPSCEPKLRPCHCQLLIMHIQIHAHQPGVWPYVIAAAGIISLDYLIRFMKTCVFNARIRPIPDLMLTRIEVPQLNAGWRAGQHVRLRVLSSAMGWFGWAESHPFTIATATKTPEGMVLLLHLVHRCVHLFLHSITQRASRKLCHNC
jgi:FAD-binding domain